MSCCTFLPRVTNRPTTLTSLTARLAWTSTQASRLTLASCQNTQRWQHPSKMTVKTSKFDIPSMSRWNRCGKSRWRWIWLFPQNTSLVLLWTVNIMLCGSVVTWQNSSAHPFSSRLSRGSANSPVTHYCHQLACVENVGTAAVLAAFWI